jgi:tRNA-splicing ligase RtcB
MELMGKFASANHHVIHKKIVRALGADVLRQVENHHNFAWKERHPTLGEGDFIVHRKGATPAGVGVLGLIPGSMATPGYLVEGLGNAASLDSASHGAGRRLSRTKARETTRWGTLRRDMEKLGIEVMSAGADECPAAYKDIESVMAAQADLVSRIAKFSPKLVRMAPEGEKAED